MIIFKATLDEKGQKKKRDKKMTEERVDEPFYGQGGLEEVSLSSVPGTLNFELQIY